MIKLDEFRRYLKIDKHALDDDIVQQPMLFYEVSEAYVVAAAERDGFKEALARVDAGLDAEIREELEKSDTKATEAMVKNQIQCHQDHEKAYKLYAKAKEQADLLAVMKDSFQQRGYMLRDLCQLYVANYFEESSVRGTSNTDAAVYKRRREHLGNAREQRQR